MPTWLTYSLPVRRLFQSCHNSSDLLVQGVCINPVQPDDVCGDYCHDPATDTLLRFSTVPYEAKAEATKVRGT